MSVSVLMVGSEALPFSKTGGLADVLGALPLALGRLGHRVTLVTPKYRGIAGSRSDTGHSGGRHRRGGQPRRGSSSSRWPKTSKWSWWTVPSCTIATRFTARAATIRTTRAVSRFLCVAALEYALQSGESFDILHAHDWQAGLAPVYLRTRYAAEPRLRGMASIFTIHNLAYQGIFPSDWLAPLELGLEMMSMDAMEFWGQISLLKGGIVVLRQHHDRQPDLRDEKFRQRNTDSASRAFLPRGRATCTAS